MTSLEAPARCFAHSYQEARAKFMAAAEAAGLDVQAHPHPLLGRDGEALALDVARDGPADSAALLIVTSACHGIEGYCGSGVQVALLGNAALRAQAQAAGVTMLHLHALNPHGFSWLRRVTQENVDLNRNFHDFTQPLPHNDAYDEIAHCLVPRAWPPSAANERELMGYAARHGEAALHSAISRGQHRHPQGLFYGGTDPTWSNLTLRQVLRDHARRCTRLGWIDLHTGLGPAGHGERILACRDEPDAYARARAWWGDAVTSIYDGSSTSPLLTGMMCAAAYDECPQAVYTGIALEFGTVPMLEVIGALRADQWLQNHPEFATTELRRGIEQQMMRTFFTDTDAWKQQVLGQAFEAVQQAVRGLSDDVRN